MSIPVVAGRILVNNAGVWVEHLVDEVEFDGWQDAWRTVLELGAPKGSEDLLPLAY